MRVTEVDIAFREAKGRAEADSASLKVDPLSSRSRVASGSGSRDAIRPARGRIGVPEKVGAP
jgi:hypothetical protein